MRRRRAAALLAVWLGLVCGGCQSEQDLVYSQMLEEGKTYLEIQEETGASTATISRVGKVLNEGTGVVAGILERKQEQDSGQEHDAGQKRDSGQKREENE